MVNNSFFCFLITYERTQFLRDTINSILRQKIKPSRIYIVDNSLTDKVEKEVNLICENFGNVIIYYKVGFNSGPAGAAKIGLQKLAYDGADWIYWGDDNDPPTDPDIFLRLFEIASKNPETGIFGKLGGKFISYRARTRVFSNHELYPIIEADYVTGGKHMIISSKVVGAGILPEPKLFFGFEELDFCLRVKDAGFSILVDGQGILNGRINAGNIQKKYRWKGKSIGDLASVNRHYYSVRNMLYILWSRGHYIGYSYFLLKAILKIPMSIIYGFPYFQKFSKLSFLGIYHQWTGRFGQFIPTT